MNATSRKLRRAALGRDPSYPRLLSAWTGDGAAYDVAANRLDFSAWWKASNIHRRMFLLLCAYDHELITQANLAAYHGDIDGDLDGA